MITRRVALCGFVLGLTAASRPAFALDQRSTFIPAAPARRAEHTQLLAVTQAGERLVAAGAHGVILLSDDFGETWRQARDVPTQTTLTSLAFISPQKGFAAGHDRVILKTEDGGESWSMRYVDIERGGPLLSIAFADANHGIAVGGFGVVLESSDGGWRWKERPLRRGDVDDLPLNKVLVVGGSVYIAADHGQVYRQAPDSDVFAPFQAPTQASFWDAIALKDGGLVFCGSKGEVWRTRRDLGGWTQIETPPAKGFTALGLTLDGRLVAAGLQGALAFTGEDGDVLIAGRAAQRTDYAALIAGGRGKLVLLGEDGISLVPDKP